MKKPLVLSINLLITFLFFNIGYGQNYVFDKIVKNEFSTELFPNQERTNFFNSKDFSYYMQVYSENDSLKSRIFDSTNNKIHFFNIEKSDSLKFYFLKTISYKKQNDNYTYEFSDIRNFKNRKEVNLTIFSEKKKVAKYSLIIKESQQNFFPFFNLTSMEPFHMMNIIPPLNFTVLSANKNGIKYKLKSIEVVNLEINIPDNIISNKDD